MTLFDDREQGFEQMFAHGEEARFRAIAKRNRLLGQWAAARRGLTGEKADAYVDEIGRSLIAHVVDETLVEKILADFNENGINVSREQIREKMTDLMATAAAEVRSSPW